MKIQDIQSGGEQIPHLMLQNSGLLQFLRTILSGVSVVFRVD